MLTRRDMLKAMGAAGVGALVAPGLLRAGAAWADVAAPAGLSYDPAPFTLGVASGYPTPGSVILWTRLAPNPLTADGGIQEPVDVRWALGTDRAALMAELEDPAREPLPAVRRRRVVARGVTQAVAASGHSVHVEATGLSPATTYWYGFASDGNVSTIGRTRTAPVGSTTRARFAVASCQRLSDGWYAAYRHIADEDLDFVLHVGDYIYESGGNGPVRTRGDGDATTLADYRIRYALYRGDPDLRRAHAMHPWILTWDDHEVWNNYIGTRSVGQRRADAYQAYYEHLPIRLTEAGPPSGSSFRIYQQVQFGDLLDVALLDTRQYRFLYRDPAFPSSYWPEHPDNTILGAEQKAWLKDLLATDTAAWRALGNASPMAHVFHFGGGVPQEGHEVLNDAGVQHVDRFDWGGGDNWDGFGQERYELLKHILDHCNGNVVNLSGDYHRNMWQNLPLDIDNPASPIVLPEFAGTSITTSSGASDPDGRDVVYASNHRVRYFDGYRHGYMVCDVTPDRWQTTAWLLRHSQNPSLDARRDVNATKFEAAVFEVNPGDPRMHHVGGEDHVSPVPMV